MRAVPPNDFSHWRQRAQQATVAEFVLSADPVANTQLSLWESHGKVLGLFPLTFDSRCVNFSNCKVSKKTYMFSC
jgi:hypothetical protein